MTTTIAVRESTLQKVEDVPKTRFGSQPKLKRFREEERAQFHGV